MARLDIGTAELVPAGLGWVKRGSASPVKARVYKRVAVHTATLYYFGFMAWNLITQ
jgi:hypothetical protein